MNWKRPFLNIARRIAEKHPFYSRFIPADMTRDEAILLFCFMAAAEE